MKKNLLHLSAKGSMMLFYSLHTRRVSPKSSVNTCRKLNFSDKKCCYQFRNFLQDSQNKFLRLFSPRNWVTLSSLRRVGYLKLTAEGFMILVLSLMSRNVSPKFCWHLFSGQNFLWLYNFGLRLYRKFGHFIWIKFLQKIWSLYLSAEVLVK